MPLLRRLSSAMASFHCDRFETDARFKNPEILHRLVIAYGQLSRVSTEYSTYEDLLMSRPKRVRLSRHNPPLSSPVNRP